MADQDLDPVIDATGISTDDGPATGPLSRIRWPWGKRGSGRAAASLPHDDDEDDSDDYRRQRRLIESFSEDYLGWADRVKLGAAKFIAFLLPIAAVLAVGTDIGAFFAQALGVFSSYVLAYSIEAGIAALTLMLGMAAQKTSESRGHWVKVGMAAGVWLVASLASGLVMYIITLSAMPASVSTSRFGQAVIFLRTGAVMLIDLISVSILFFRGKSLQKYLQEQGQKAHAIQAANEGELAITRAQEQARMRRQEDEQYLDGKRRAAEVVIEMQEMTNQALLDMARRNLLKGPDEGNNKRVGRY